MSLAAASVPDPVCAMADPSFHFYRVFYGPSAAPNQSRPQQACAYAGMAGQFGQGETLALVDKELVRNSVVGLLPLSCPPAIVWFVISVVVLPVKRCIDWALTHISKEVGKLLPSFANGNAALLVMGKRWARWVKASSKHVLPRTVCGRFPATPSGVPVLAPAAPARGCVSSSQFVGGYQFLSPAYASAKPERFFVLGASGFRQNGPIGKGLVGNVYGFHSEILL